MAEKSRRSNKGPFTGKVSANRRIGERFYRLVLVFSEGGASAFAGCRPGQFAQIDLSGAPLPAADAIPSDLADSAGRNILLRRPFSFADVSAKEGQTTVEILYRVVGPGSLRMTGLKKGDGVSLIGPLGNGFAVPARKRKAFLVTGGMGAGPLIHLAKKLSAEAAKIEVTAFVGARAREELPFEGKLDKLSQELGFSLGEFAKYGIKSRVATDDGSAGYEGLVTDCFAEWLGKQKWSAKDAIIFGCGPEAMLAALAKIAQGKNIDCQVSTERMMACGIGVCQSCAVECREEDSENVYKMCCKDGPVFDAKEVIFKL